MVTREEIREGIVEIVASALSDNDVRPRVNEILFYLHSEGIKLPDGSNLIEDKK